MKQTIRLTESQFKKVITETIKKVLREEDVMNEFMDYHKDNTKKEKETTPFVIGEPYPMSEKEEKIFNDQEISKMLKKYGCTIESKSGVITITTNDDNLDTYIRLAKYYEKTDTYRILNGKIIPKIELLYILEKMVSL